MLNSLSRHVSPSTCSLKSKNIKHQHQPSFSVHHIRQCQREPTTGNHCLPGPRPSVTRQGQGAAGSSIDEAVTESSSSSNGTGTGSSRPELTSSSDVPVEQLQRLDALPMKEARYELLAAWVAAAVAFGAGIWYFQGSEKSAEFFAGYLLEQSLSVDNLFVFVLVFKYFKTPLENQNKVLQYGIYSAAILRGIMIIAGVSIIEDFQPALLVFAGILLFSSFKLLSAGDDDDEEEDLGNNFVVKACRRLIPVTDNYDGDKFFTVQNGVKMATPLLLTLAVIELCDVVFAVDSVPAVLGVTLDPFIVYTSNLFAILSLRALYFFVSTIMSELRFLDRAVALVLGFIGIKMVLGFAGIDIPTEQSLLVVGGTLGAGVGASLLLPEPDKE